MMTLDDLQKLANRHVQEWNSAAAVLEGRSVKILSGPYAGRSAVIRALFSGGDVGIGSYAWLEAIERRDGRPGAIPEATRKDNREAYTFDRIELLPEK